MSASTSPEGTRRLVHELYAAGRVRGASILTVRDGKIAGVTDYGNFLKHGWAGSPDRPESASPKERTSWLHAGNVTSRDGRLRV